MTTDRDVEDRIAAWLEAGPTNPAPWAVDEALDRAGRLHQRRYLAISTRSVPMFTAFRTLAAAAIVVVIAFGAWRLLPLSPSAGSAPSPAPGLPTATFQRDVSANGAGAPEGSWSLSFSSGQLWLAGPSGERIVNQVTSSTGDTLVLGSDLNPDVCSFGQGTGTYGWVVSGTTLTLTAVSDPSGCRSTVLAGSWTAAP